MNFLHRVAMLWDKFWFEPRSVAPVCLFRIVFGVLLLQTVLVHMRSDFAFYYGSGAMWPIEGIAEVHWPLLEPRVDLLMLVPGSDGWLQCVYIALAVSSVLFTLGLFTRVSNGVAFLCLLSFHTHCPTNLNSGDLYQRLVLFLLWFSPCADMYSLDSLLAARKGGAVASTSAPWAQRLIQMQLCIAYLQTTVCKIVGLHWQDGTAVYYATRFEEFHCVGLPLIFDIPIVCKLLTYATIALELALFTLIWWRKCRVWVIVLGCIFHIGLACSFNLPVFEEMFMATYILFLDPQSVENFVNKLVSRLQSRSLPIAN